MAANIEVRDGVASFARNADQVDRAWWETVALHGQQFDDTTPLEEVAKLCGFDWEITKRQVEFVGNLGRRAFPKKFVLARSDNDYPLAIASDRWNPVQPMEALEFFRKVITDLGWKLLTAFVLKNGEKYCAMAQVPFDLQVGPLAGKPHVLLATGSDTQTATTAKSCATVVVCNNTMNAALKEDGAEFKVHHNKVWDPDAARQALGMVDFSRTWEEFQQRSALLYDLKIDEATAKQFFSDLLRPKPLRRDDLEATTFDDLLTGPAKVDYQPIKVEKEREIRGLGALLQAYQAAPGALPGTGLGLVQAVTYWTGTVRGNPANRANSVLFGSGGQMADRAVEMASRMAGLVD